MHLHACTHGHQLLALLDSGLTHNLINVRVMCHTGLATMNTNTMRVIVTNGNYAPYEGMTCNTVMHIN